jgi:hypothetical protein
MTFFEKTFFFTSESEFFKFFTQNRINNSKRKEKGFSKIFLCIFSSFKNAVMSTFEINAPYYAWFLKLVVTFSFSKYQPALNCIFHEMPSSFVMIKY